MNKKTLLICAALAAAFAAPLVPAQGNGVARLKDVKGNVLVSQRSGLASGSEAERLPDHTRVITTAGAEVTVVYDNGCEVRLKENQRFEVEGDKPCAALIAVSLLAQPTVAAGVAVGSFAIPVVGVGIAAGILTSTTPPLSPN